MGILKGIYVRCNPFTSQQLIEVIEQAGSEQPLRVERRSLGGRWILAASPLALYRLVAL
ncbi:MAG: hypothetical protein JW797_12280 [Bradymonadales bacterium]|nr:hypothetical protein [Bradymonadales bacterium]